jgi:hypothetical protein
VYAPLADIDDPQDCPDCLAMRDLCPYHAGVADGWDYLAAVVGLLVTEAG